ncbi:portal protein [Castellaniella sp. S9]|uniref:portal protein n=1 Tax=Castellaniella sp. S9 TaxID=2993652 RepID=UPI0022B3582A|nr:portal protein [Castellaniella sp. S9]
MALAVESDSADRALALDDLKFMRGGEDQWPAEAVTQRKIDGRPLMTFNKLPASLRQITNDQRQNTPSIKVHPVDSGADIETAKVIQGIVRHIEYDSDADVAYDTAVNSAATCGRGFFRLVTDYESETSFNQVIRFKRERNPLNVFIDPFSTKPDGSDMGWAFIIDAMPKSEFKRQHPKAAISSADFDAASIGASAAHWFQGDAVVVAEYYWIDEVAATLIMLSDGTTGYKDDFNADVAATAGVSIVAERESTRRRVRWAKITGADVLEETDIQCRWIPVFPVYGDEIDVGGEVTRRGMVRDAKDPARMYNFWMTTATEEVALRPKTPFIGAAGQFEADKAKWATANLRSWPYIQYTPKTIDGHLAPPPQRQPMADVPIGVLQMAAHANEDIKSVTGIFDASLGARSNETSGRAIMARQREGDLSNFHFTDNLNRAVRHAGRCIIDMLPHYYDTERVVQIRGDDEALDSAQINTPVTGDDGTQRILNDLTVGKYDVTVTAGPSYTTQRQEAADGMTQLAQAWPKMMDIAGDKVIGNLDWPGADEVAERIKRTIPPEIRGPEEGEEQQAIPPQVQQQMAQMQQMLQQAQQALQEAQSGVEKARIDADSRVAVAQINAQSRQDVEELKGMVKLLSERLQPPAPLTAAAYRTGADPGAPPAQQSTSPTSPLPQAGFSFGSTDFAPAQSPIAPGAVPATSGAVIPDDPL